MEQQAIFKSAAFGGFDKKSVLDFIDELTESHHQTEESLRRKINEFSKAQDSQLAHIQQLKGEIAQKDEEISTLRQKLSQQEAAPSTDQPAAPAAATLESDSELQQELNALRENNQNVQSELSRVQGDNRVLLDEITRLKAQLTQEKQTTQAAQSEAGLLRQQLDNTSANGTKEKDLDNMLRKIGDAMVVAQCNADKIVEDAKSQAQETLESAQSQAKKTVEDASKRSSAMFEDAKSRANQILQDAQQRDTQSLEKTKAEIQQLQTEAQGEISKCFAAVPLMREDCITMQKQMENTLYSLDQRVKDLLTSLQSLESRQKTLAADSPVPLIRGVEEPAVEDYPELSIPSEEKEAAPAASDPISAPADVQTTPELVHEAAAPEPSAERFHALDVKPQSSQPAPSDFPDLSALDIKPQSAQPAPSDFPDLSALDIKPQSTQPAPSDFPDLSALDVKPQSTQPTSGDSANLSALDIKPSVSAAPARGHIEPLPDLDAVLAKFSGNAYGTVTPVVQPKKAAETQAGLPDGELFGLKKEEAQLFGFSPNQH